MKQGDVRLVLYAVLFWGVLMGSIQIFCLVSEALQRILH